jgi:hypothetical protein
MQVTRQQFMLDYQLNFNLLTKYVMATSTTYRKKLDAN